MSFETTDEDLRQHFGHRRLTNGIFEDFGDSALIFDVYVWIDSFGDTDLRTLRSNIRFRITELFEANDIVIAFPQRDVHIDGQVQLVRPPIKNGSQTADS